MKIMVNLPLKITDNTMKISDFSLSQICTLLNDWLKSRPDGRELLSKPGDWEIGGTIGSIPALITATLISFDNKKRILAVTPNQNYNYEFCDDLVAFGGTLADPEKDKLPPKSFWIYPIPHLETLPYETQPPHPQIRIERLTAIESLLIETGDPVIYSMPVRSLMHTQAMPQKWSEELQCIEIGKEVDRDKLLSRLGEQGYEYRELITTRGEFSYRGGIVDIFPWTAARPIRFELFGDEVDSIREFDPASQRSVKSLTKYLLYPGDESYLSNSVKDNELTTIRDFLPEDVLSILIDPDSVLHEAERFEHLAVKMFDEIGMAQAEILGRPPRLPDVLYRKCNQIDISHSDNTLVLNPFKIPPEDFSDKSVRNWEIRSIDKWSGEAKSKLKEFVGSAKEKNTGIICCDTSGQKQRLEELLKNTEGFSPKLDIHLLETGLHHGFEFPDINLVVLTDREIFGRYKKLRFHARSGIAIPILDMVDLKPGDFVVHIDHGIAKYKGLRRLKVEGEEGEFLELRFDQDAACYVPIDQIERIGKYIGSDKAPPKLSRLGGKGWQTAKSKAERSIEEMAEELLELYAKRQIQEGYRTSTDTIWQKEFEASFIYDETPDQLRSIEEIKKDMESERPMDRLICGDVGFGKTEVALRGAFKAIMDGKQVAMLCPTTILAQQHYHTFKSRMADYPVEVDMLSRFRSTTEIKESIQKIKDGNVDIVVGTHRLLSKDIGFRDLGLLIIDEEQRFGVKHKERLKQLKTQVDCLNLSATPIPRTLYLSLSGVRDMSLVNTAPKNRLPILTYIAPFKKETVENAILRELARGGQVYFVHNRVRSIERIAQLVGDLVPEARIAIGHGQMDEKELEQVMVSFINREYDILVSTTIIESGLDIPNVNTIIINRADAFGLAELYQLRGRVGREHHQAYCYLLISGEKSISNDARQRLLALQEFNQLGDGFKVALRDLEIRGMGNILGREQHGHIAAIGFDLYSKLLKQTVDKLKGKDYEESFNTIVEPKNKGDISPDYIPSVRQRMSIFKRLAGIKTINDIKTIEAELNDIYGRFPPKVEQVFLNARIKAAANRAGIDLVKWQKKSWFLRYAPSMEKKFNPAKLAGLDESELYSIRVEARDKLILHVTIISDSKDKLLLDLLKQLVD